MKKLLFTLLACFVALAANAANPVLYLRGDTNSWGTGNTKSGQSSKFTEDNGVYTLTLSSLTGSFKIADASWSSTANFGGSGATTISMDKDYTLISSGTSGNLTPDANWTDVTLTFTLSTRVLRVTGKQKEQVITWGLKGNFTSSSWPTIDMVETTSGSGIWTGSVAPLQADCLFGIAKLGDGAQIDWYTNTGATISESNPTVTLGSGDGDTKATLSTGKTYTFTWNENSKQLSLTWVDEVSYPENMYVIGTIGGNAWSPTNVAAMTTTGDGIYTIESVSLGENGGSCGFALTANEGKNDSDWDTVNALRFGPVEKDTKANVGTNNVDGTGDVSWAIDPGTYKMVFDLPNKTLTITAVGEVVPPIPDSGSFYVIGVINGDNWTVWNELNAANNYTLEFTSLETFKMTDKADWNGATEYGSNGSNLELDKAYTLSKGGGNISMAPGHTATNGKLVLDPKTMTITVTGTEVAAALELYLRGDMNGWGTTDKMQPNSDNTEYSITLPSLDAGVGFKIATSSYNPEYSTGNTAMENGTYDVVPGADNMALGSGMTNVTITLNLNTQKVTISGTPTGAFAELYLYNSTNDWAKADEFKFATEDGVTYTLDKLNLPANATFKVGNATWADNFTYTYIESAIEPNTQYTLVNNTDGNANMWIEEAIENGTVTYNLSTHAFEIAVENTPVVPPTPDYGETIEATYTFENLSDAEGYYPSLPPTDEWTTDASSNKKFALPSGTKFDVKGASLTLNSTSDGNICFYWVSTSGKTDLRVSTGGTLTLSVPNGYSLNKIDFGTGGTNTTINKLALVEGEPGTLVNEPTKHMVWTAPATRAADAITSVTFQVSGTTATRISTINVTASQITTGVEEIVAEDESNAVYYNLQGVRVQNPERGIFVRVLNGKAVKVVK